MKKSYFFVSATLAALIILLLTLLVAFAIGYRFDTVVLSDYGRVTYYGKPSGGTVYLGGMTAIYTKGEKRLDYENGDVYIGEIGHYLPNGVGRYEFAGGDVYEGEMLNGLADGQGILTFANGDTLEGRFEKSELVEGTLTVTQKGKTFSVTGRFEKSNFSGNFSYNFPDGAYYEGGYLNGLPDGAGKLDLPNGDCYEGSFRNGTFDGYGTYTFADGSVLFCQFEKGVPHGKGSYTYVENGKEKSISGQFFDGYYLPESES